MGDSSPGLQDREELRSPRARMWGLWGRVDPEQKRPEAGQADSGSVFGA